MSLMAIQAGVWKGTFKAERVFVCKCYGSMFVCLPLVKYKDITAKKNHDFQRKKEHPLNKVNLHEMQNKKRKFP